MMITAPFVPAGIALRAAFVEAATSADASALG